MNNQTEPQKCTFCALPAVPSDTTDPPACGAHADLWILVEWMEAEAAALGPQAKNEPVTPETVAAHITRARATSGGWTITPGQVGAMLGAILKTREAITNE